MTYTQNAPKYDAHQWVGGLTASEFGALVDPGNFVTWSVNGDGSLHFAQGDFLSGDVPLNNWVVSTPYWSATPAWFFPNTIITSSSGNPTFTNTEFTEQFTSTS